MRDRQIEMKMTRASRAHTHDRRARALAHACTYRHTHRCTPARHWSGVVQGDAAPPPATPRRSARLRRAHARTRLCVRAPAYSCMCARTNKARACGIRRTSLGPEPARANKDAGARGPGEPCCPRQFLGKASGWGRAPLRAWRGGGAAAPADRPPRVAPCGS